MVSFLTNAHNLYPSLSPVTPAVEFTYIPEREGGGGGYLAYSGPTTSYEGSSPPRGPPLTEAATSEGRLGHRGQADSSDPVGFGLMSGGEGHPGGHWHHTSPTAMEPTPSHFASVAGFTASQNDAETALAGKDKLSSKPASFHIN